MKLSLHEFLFVKATAPWHNWLIFRRIWLKKFSGQEGRGAQSPYKISTINGIKQH